MCRSRSSLGRSQRSARSAVRSANNGRFFTHEDAGAPRPLVRMCTQMTARGILGLLRYLNGVVPIPDDASVWERFEATHMQLTIYE